MIRTDRDVYMFIHFYFYEYGPIFSSFDIIYFYSKGVALACSTWRVVQQMMDIFLVSLFFSQTVYTFLLSDDTHFEHEVPRKI